MRKSSSTPVDTNVLCVLAQIDMALGRFEDAVIVAEKGVRLEPHNLELSDLFKRARAVAIARTTGNDLYKAGRWLEAAVAYGEGLQYNPTNAVLLCNRAACRSVHVQWIQVFTVASTYYALVWGSSMRKFQTIRSIQHS